MIVKFIMVIINCNNDCILTMNISLESMNEILFLLPPIINYDHIIYLIIFTPTKRSDVQLLKNLRLKTTTALEKESKIGECHAKTYGFLRLLYKYEVRKFSRFVRFTLHVITVY